MINLEEWSDYKFSYDRIKSVQWHTRGGKAPRLLIACVKNVLKNNGFVPEDKDCALRLIGEKTPDVDYAVLGAKKLMSDMVGNKQ